MAKNNLNIPEIRTRLKELAKKHEIAELSELADQMYRNYTNKRAPVQSNKSTPELAEKIREYHKKNPNMSQQDIAVHFKVNHGRVSEALNNKI